MLRWRFGGSVRNGGGVVVVKGFWRFRPHTITSHHTRSNQVKPHHITSHQVKSAQTISYHITPDQTKPYHSKSHQIRSDQTTSTTNQSTSGVQYFWFFGILLSEVSPASRSSCSNQNPPQNCPHSSGSPGILCIKGQSVDRPLLFSHL